MTTEFKQELVTYIRAGYPILSVISGEEDRVLDCLDEVLRNRTYFKQPRQLFIWSVSQGIVKSDGGKPPGSEKTAQPEQALMFMAKVQEPALFMFKDFHPYIKEGYPHVSLVIRMIRDLVNDLKARGKTMIWVSPVLHIPPELEKELTILDMPLPAEEEYRDILQKLIEPHKKNPKIRISLDEEGVDRIVKACQGLTKCEAENALAKALVTRESLDGNDVGFILSEKEQIIRKSGILEYFAAVETFGGMGGLGKLKQWLKQRNQAFSQKARDFGLPHPRGVLLVGVPGCGKSLCAKSVAAEWQKPLLKFDLGRVFDKYVGSSEERMRKALSVAESVAPAVLWIDELEKGLSGMGAGDNGVSLRVFGNLLTWMEEKQKPVFVVATANDISRIPPELLRKGRFDEIFFVDLPAPKERAEILMIHLAKRRRDIADFPDLAAVVHQTEGFSGAELEEVVNSALFEAFSAETKAVKTAHLLKAASQIIPLSRSRKQEIDHLRKWAAVNCRPASTDPETDPQAGPETLSELRVRMVEI